MYALLGCILLNSISGFTVVFGTKLCNVLLHVLDFSSSYDEFTRCILHPDYFLTKLFVEQYFNNIARYGTWDLLYNTMLTKYSVHWGSHVAEQQSTKPFVCEAGHHDIASHSVGAQCRDLVDYMEAEFLVMRAYFTKDVWAHNSHSVDIILLQFWH